MNKFLLPLVSVILLSAQVFAQSNVGIGTNNPASKLDVNGNLTIGSGYSGTAAPSNGAIIEGNVGIGTNAPNAKALLDVSSTTQGVFIPRMTTVQRDAIAGLNSTHSGLLIYNTDTNRSQYWNGSSWTDIGSGVGGPPTGAAGGDLTGTYPNPNVANNAITSAKILDGQITSADLATPAVNATNQIFNTLPIANGGTGTSSTPANGNLLIGNGAGYNVTGLTPGSGINITNSAGSISISTTGAPPTGLAGGDLTGSYPNPTILAGAVNGGAGGDILDNSVTGADVDETTLVHDNLIDDNDLQAGAVDGGLGGEIQDATITSADLAATGVGAGTYNNVTVNAQGQVTGGSNAAYLTGNQTITLSGDVSGSGTTAITTTIGASKVLTGMIADGTIAAADLAATGVTAGTYPKVTVNAQGQVTGGSALAATDLPPGAAAGNTPYWNGSTWVLNNANIFNNGGNVGIGTSLPGFKLHVPSGYIGTDYINTTDNSVSSGVTGVMVKQGDNYHRTATAAALASFLNTTGTWIPNNGNGDWQIASSSTSTGYGAATLELRESNFTNNGSATPPHLGFHWGGVVASNIALEGSGRIAIRDNPGTGYENLIARETYTTGWFRNTSSGAGLYNEATASGIYSPSAGLMTLYNGSSLQVTSAQTSAGNIRFDAANPYITASSYFIAPGGAYFNGGTVYFEAATQHRAGISNDAGYAGGDVQVNENLRIAGVVPCIQGNCPSNSAIRLTPNLHLNSNAGYAVIGNWDNGTTGNTQTLRIGNGAGADVFNVWANGNTSIGTTPSALYMAYSYHNQLTGNGDGQAAVYGFRTRDSQNDGSGYYIGQTNAGVMAYNYWGDVYTFGVHGHTWGDYTRTGGVLGSTNSGSAWGVIGYKASNSVGYGVYGSTGYASGGGFLPSSEVVGIGGGFAGGVIGSWSMGEVMGQVSKGDLFASYNMGNEYTSGFSADIVTVGEERMPAFSLTSTDLKVYSDGEGALKGTSVFVPFETSYIKLLGDKPRVTVSPMGASANIFIKSVTREGFIVASDNAVQVEFSWIAVGKRADAAERVQLPSSIANKDFDKNMKGVLFNENDKEHSATPVWWNGSEVQFTKAPEKDHSAEKAAETARMEAEKAKAKASADEVTRTYHESMKQLVNDPAQEKAAAAMKANSVTHPEIHPVGPQGPPAVEKSISLEGENLPKK